MSDRGGELGRAAGRAGALGLLRAAPRGPAPAAGTHGRAARGILGYVFARLERGPDTSFSTFSPPPQLRGGRAERGSGRRSAACLLRPRLPHLGQTAAALRSRADLPAPCRAQRLRGALLPRPPSAWSRGGARWRATPALGLAGSGHSPGRVAALAGKARAQKAQVVRLEAAERSTRSRTLTPHNSAPRESRKTSGANSVCPDRLLVSPAVDSKLIKHETDPSLSQL